MTEKYKVTGMSCAVCSARVERAVSSLEGVSSCSVNLLTADMTVEGAVTRDEVISAVVNAGYGVADVTKADIVHKDDKSRALTRELTVSLGLVAVIMYLSMGHMIGLWDPFNKIPLVNGILQMIISATVMVINRRFFISGFKGLVHRAPNMDTLVSLGSLASFGYSFAMLIIMSIEVAGGGSGMEYLHGFYFESAAMILALITLGKMLEARAKGKTTSALEGLISLKGKYATLLVDGIEKTVPVDDVKIGDVFVVRPGESIPTDGEIISGVGAIDESMLTGESIPRDVLSGDSVYGGSINKSGFITVKATKVGEGTLLANIIRMVEEASGSKAPIAKLADKVSSVFVPCVLLISLVTLIGWLAVGKELGFAIARAISVLVISCPCALGLATPVAIMVGSGVGARREVLFKTAAAIEEMGRVDTVVLDKTGTLTVGEPKVTDVVCAEGIDEKELISLAYSVEKMSEHPIARALVKHAEEVGADSYEVEKFESEPGKGVSAVVGGKKLSALSFAEAGKVADVPTELANVLSEQGKTPLAFVYDGKYIGTIAVSDTLKSDAKESVEYLRSMGLKVVMLSGDNERTARAVALTLGIDNVIAGVLPDGKDEVVRSLMEEGKVCMVGDGINDSPALTRANVGVAIGHGTDIAIDSADVVVMGKGISEVAHAIGIGRATLTNIRENLFWAFIYNCIGIPLAAGLFGLSLSPMIGAAMMSLSSVSVVSNALRLNLWKPKKMYNNLDECKPTDTNNDVEETISEAKENENMTVVIKVDGMMCPHCEARVKKACESCEGVTLATPSHTEGTVTLEMTSDVTEACKKAISDAGYDVVV